MKTNSLLLFLLFITLYQGCENSVSPNYNFPFDLPAPDDSTISDSLKNLYQQDGVRLALRYLYSQGSSDTVSIEIPEQLTNLFYKALIYVYNSQDLNYPTSNDKVIQIHTFPEPNLSSLIVKVDTSQSWTKAWQNKNITTGNKQVDELLFPYNFQVSSFSYSWAVLRTNMNLNIRAVCRELEKISGITYAEPNGFLGDGNNITANINQDKIVITYSYGWGDCPSGCIARHYWEYYVMPDGSVVLNREYGTTL